MSSKPLPPLFPTVAASVASPINLTPWVGMACTLDGRDKITKVAAYSSRFLAFWYAASDPAAASKFGDLKAHLTMSRKAFRIGKFLNEIEKIRKLMARPTFDPLEGDEKDERVKPANALRTYQKALMILKCVGLGGFWVSENILLLTRGSSFLYRDDKDTQKSLAKTAQQFGARMYFMGAVAFLIQSIRDIVNHEKTVAEVTSKEGVTEEELKALQLKKFGYYVSLMKSVCDCIVFSNISGVDLHRKYRGKPLNEGIASIAGLGSASTVIWNNYPKAKK